MIPAFAKALGPLASGLGGALIGILTRLVSEHFIGHMIYRTAKGYADRYAAKADARAVKALSTKGTDDDAEARADQATARKWQAVVSDLGKTLGIK